MYYKHILYCKTKHEPYFIIIIKYYLYCFFYYCMLFLLHKILMHAIVNINKQTNNKIDELEIT
jgi:hypothetical protein